jgi:hypothetical protein
MPCRGEGFKRIAGCAQRHNRVPQGGDQAPRASAPDLASPSTMPSVIKAQPASASVAPAGKRLVFIAPSFRILSRHRVRKHDPYGN